jgi:2-polyprenyl-6-methoxyphenol hydroxylase-like FAD-dependent oxidoreductase
MRIAINGAGIAGPTLAWWLRKSNHDVLLIERSPQLRTAGYIIDFWGVGYDIAEKMGILPRVRELGYQVREVRLVDREGHKVGGFDVDVFQRTTHGRFTSILRSDLSATIYHALDGVETIFGDSIAGIREVGDSVRLTFERTPPREVDLVIGADGLHSRVRQLVFGSDGGREVSLGYHVAAFEVEGYRPRDELVYVTHGIPGRQVSRFTMRNDRTMILFVFRNEYMSAPPTTADEQKAELRTIFAGVGWECQQILAAMDAATDFYFDRVSQIRMDRWSSGRTALAGDAAACVSLLAGEGTGLAMAEAYVLAGELGDCGGDHAAAFARYEQRLMPFLRKKQAAAVKFASSFAPKTAFGVRARNVVTRLLGNSLIADFVVGRELRDEIELPDYAFLPAGASWEAPARSKTTGSRE